MSLQAKREPLPAAYQFPTTPCACPSCASRLIPETLAEFEATVIAPALAALCRDVRSQLVRQAIECDVPVLEPDAETPWAV